MGGNEGLDVELVRGAREGVGDSATLLIDAGCVWDARAAQSRARVPDTARVDQQRGTVANPFTRATNQFDVEPFVPAHRFPAELYGLLACPGPAPADFGSLPAVTAEENRRVRLDTVMLFASEQPMDGLLEKLSLQIPHSHVDGAHGADGHRAATEIHRASIHFLPKTFGLQRVFADQYFTQTAGNVVTEWSINDCLDDLRRSVRLTDAFKSIVGANPHQRDVLATDRKSVV